MNACQQCGRPLVDGRCSRCSNGALSRFIHRELTVLILLSAIASVVFLATRSIAAAHRDLRRRDAAQWFRFGQSELAAGQPLRAVQALRRATAIDLHNVEYRLALASALEDARKNDLARQVLLELRSVSPERPDINTRLARLEVARGDDSAAIRYYQNALYGVWAADAMEGRRVLRLEFIRFLLSRKYGDRALAELLAIEDSIGSDTASRTEAGHLLLQAGDPSRALVHYRAALRQDPQNAAALAGAGKAAFASGEYAIALRYLRTASELPADLIEVRSLASHVLTRDPLLPRLSFAERRRRLQLNLSDALTRLGTCTVDGPSSSAFTSLRHEIEAVQARLARRSVREALEVIEDGAELVYRVQQKANGTCGPPALIDRAQLLIGQRHRVEPQ